jgi:hypothetical protein
LRDVGGRGAGIGHAEIVAPPPTVVESAARRAADPPARQVSPATRRLVGNLRAAGAAATYARSVSTRRRTTGAGTVPTPFDAALASIRGVTLRPEVVLEETPAPQRLSPFAVALQAEVVVDDEEAASGRFVLLHDPEGQEPWAGTFRVVSFVKGTVELDIAQDPMLTEVAWSWLVEALEDRGAEFRAESGTVTRTASQSFGAIEDRPPSGDVEIRASWTPRSSDLAPHLQAWADVLAQVAGLPPLPVGVAALPAPRRR